MMQESGHEDVSLQMCSKVTGDLKSISSSIIVINKLSTEIDRKCADFKSQLADAHKHLDRIYRHQRKHIEAAKRYYDVQRDRHLAHDKLQQATEANQRALLELDDAKDNAAVAEKSLMSVLASVADPDPDILTNLNKATQWVADCSVLVEDTESRVAKYKSEFDQADAQLKALTESLKTSITKAKPYYDKRVTLQAELDRSAAMIHRQHEDLKEARQSFKFTFSRLDVITAAQVKQGDILPHLAIEMDKWDTLDDLPLGDYTLADHLSSTTTTISSNNNNSTTTTPDNASLLSSSSSLSHYNNNNLFTNSNSCKLRQSASCDEMLMNGGGGDGISLDSAASACSKDTTSISSSVSVNSLPSLPSTRDYDPSLHDPGSNSNPISCNMRSYRLRTAANGFSSENSDGIMSDTAMQDGQDFGNAQGVTSRQDSTDLQGASIAVSYTSSITSSTSSQPVIKSRSSSHSSISSQMSTPSVSSSTPRSIPSITVHKPSQRNGVAFSPPAKMLSGSAIDEMKDLEQSLYDLEQRSVELGGEDDRPIDLSLGFLTLTYIDDLDSSMSDQHSDG